MLYDDYDNVNDSSKYLPTYKKVARNVYSNTILIIAAIAICIAVVAFGFLAFSFFDRGNNDNNLAVVENTTTNVIEETKNVVTEPEVIEQEVVAQAVVESNVRYLPAHDMNDIKKKFLPRQLENPVETIKNLYFEEEKQVFLTFDDGPTDTVTPQILDILKAEGVPATFFILGSRAERHPEILKRAYDEGHYIANHGYSHVYSTIYSSVETVWGEYAQTEQVIRNCIGIQEYNSFLFRFPGGSSGGKYSKIKANAKEYFDSQRIANINWNALSGDAEGAETKEEQLEYIRNTSQDNTLIVLMHDAYDKQVTIETLPEIIKYYREQGYVFKNFYEIF